MNAPYRLPARLRHLRGAPHYLTSLLAAAAQRHAILRPCASLILESRLIQGIWKFSIPTTLTLAGTHSLSGATTDVVPASGSKNPASGQVGANFSWFFTSSGVHRAASYTVSGLPPGLTYKYGSPVASITGKPTTAGTSKITIKGWENSNRTGGSTPIYTLTLNVTSPAPVITALSNGGEYAPGAGIDLSVTATGTALTYQWYRNTTAIPGATAALYSIPALGEDTAGSYTVKVTSGGASVTSNPIVITLKKAVDAWKSTYWSGSELTDPTISGIDADPDKDALPNVLEYVLDLDPKAPNANIPETIGVDPTDDQFIVYTIPLNPDATDFTVRIEKSASLADGVWALLDEADPANHVTRTPTQLTVKLPKSSVGAFLRLVSTVP